MKKALLFMFLVLMGAMWSSVDARWVIGDRKTADEIKVGDTIVIEQSSRTTYLGYYIQATNSDAGVEVLSGTGVDDAAMIVVEEGPADLRTGEPTVLLRLLATDMYIGTTYWTGGGCGVVADPANAGNFLILSCAEDIPWSTTVAWAETTTLRPGMEGMDEISNWRTNTNTGGRGSDENSVGFAYSTSETTTNYLGFWYSTEPDLIIWQYTDTNQWNVYEATYEKEPKDDLATIIDQYTSNTDVEFIAGTDPGYYDAEKVDAYNQTLEEALVISVTEGLSDDEYQAAIDKLKAAYNDAYNSKVPITDGYYFIVNGFSQFLDNFGVEKAAYIDASVPSLKYKTFDSENIDFVFKLTKSEEENEFFVQSYANDLYVGKGTVWYNSPPAITEDPEEPQNIRSRYTGLWFWSSSTYQRTSYTPFASHTPTASDSQGTLTTWGLWDDIATTVSHSNLWYFRAITAEQMAAFANKKVQTERDAELTEKVQEAKDLYAKLFNLIPDYDKPLITRASGGYDVTPDADNQITFSTIRHQGLAKSDMYAFLIDGDSSTYMQGSGYITIKLDEPKQYVTFVYDTRGGTDEQIQWGFEERPKVVSIYGRNSLEGDSLYGQPIFSNVDMSEIAPHTFNLGRPVNMIAYQVSLNYKGSTYFTLSEFQIYEANVDEATSQYYTTAGLSTVADAMNNLASAKLLIAKAGTSTEADIQELEQAISSVRALYADTTELIALIDKAQGLIDNVTVGENFGQVATEEAKTTLSNAIVSAREQGLKDNMTRDDVVNATNSLSAAITAFMAQIKSIEEGKWYFIISADDTDGSLINGKAIYASGFAESSALRAGKVVDGQPNYTYDPYSMWRFIKAGDGGYYVQNMGTGFYMPGGATSGTTAGQSYTRTISYTIDLNDNGSFYFQPNVNNSRGNVLGLTAPTEEAEYVNVTFMENAATAAWTFIEIDPEETGAIVISDYSYNVMDVMALPYNYSGVADFNEDCHVLGIKKMTYDEATDITTIDFYEKDSVAANEPAFLYFGNVANESEDFELILPFPTEVVDQLQPANGLYGMLHPEDIAEGIGYSSGKELIVAPEGGTGISAHTGAIDPKYYTGEVTGVATTLTLTVKGLKWPSAILGDVNGDGDVNSADVTAIYSYIETGEASGIELSVADVNGDGDVNSADATATYDIISGSATGGSPKYVAPDSEAKAE